MGLLNSDYSAQPTYARPNFGMAVQKHDPMQGAPMQALQQGMQGQQFMHPGALQPGQMPMNPGMGHIGAPTGVMPMNPGMGGPIQGQMQPMGAPTMMPQQQFAPQGFQTQGFAGGPMGARRF